MSDIENEVYKFFKNKNFTSAGIAGILGNANAESNVRSVCLENTGKQQLKITDQEYASKVDNGTYTNFIYDGYGWGIFQWTWHTRKKALLNFAKQKNKSIGDLSMQLDFFVKELQQSFSSVYKILTTSTDVRTCSDAMLFKFEAPDGASFKSQRRYNMSMIYYNKFVKGEIVQMSTNTYVKGAKKQLSRYFNSTEFDCHGSGCCLTTLINPKLIEYLDKLREHFNSPITISSGYRCTTHNRNVGGATGSRHSKGDAADIVVKGHSPREVAQYAESIGIKGIGLYETAKDGYFVHIDTRNNKSFWYGQAQVAKATFGSNSSSSIKTSTAKNYLSIGDSGNQVKNLQQSLIRLGYLSSGEDDGIYGNNTANAVRAFQKEQNLVADGYAGQNTLNAIAKLNKTSEAKTITITANILNVRTGPGAQYPIVDRVSRGASYQLLEQQNGWGRISKGWVSMEYVS